MAQSTQSKTQPHVGWPKAVNDAFPSATAAHCGNDYQWDALPDGTQLLPTDGAAASTKLVSPGTCESELI